MIIGMRDQDILEEALELTSGERNQEYGEPTDDFQTIAAMWSVLFRHKLKDDCRVEPHEVAKAMIALKMSRMTKSPGKRDHWVDIAGYARCGWLCAERL